MGREVSRKDLGQLQLACGLPGLGTGLAQHGHVHPREGRAAAELLEGKAPGACGVKARGQARPARERLDDQGAAAAHGVEQTLLAIPVGLGGQGRRQVLPQGGLALGLSPSTFKEWFTGGVDRERGLLAIHKEPDANVGQACVDGGTIAGAFPHAVAQAILHSKAGKGQCELKARAAALVHVHPEGLGGRHELLPRNSAGSGENVVGLLKPALVEQKENPGGGSQPEVGAGQAIGIGPKLNATTGSLHFRQPFDGLALFGQQGLKPRRADGKARQQLAGRNQKGLTTTSTTAPSSMSTGTSLNQRNQMCDLCIWPASNFRSMAPQVWW